MYLKSIRIENYRLLRDVTITLDRSLTLFVGKNNTGKTSTMHLMELLISGPQPLPFDDYPLDCRQKLYSAVRNFWSDSSEKRIENFQHNVPVTSVTLTVNYSDDRLGNVSEFIIDLDESIEDAVIRISFDVSPAAGEALDGLKEKFDLLVSSESSDKNIALQSLIKKNFEKLFVVNIMAVNPSKPDDVLSKGRAALQNLFCLKVISAERNMDESEDAGSGSLGKVMTSLFNDEMENTEADVQESMAELRKLIAGMNLSLQEQVDAHMNRIVRSMMRFGYPSADDLELHANSNIDLEQSISRASELTYLSKDSSEILPGSHNGLGYKNLIKITLELHEFVREIRKDGKKLPLLFLEEPEAHMHPQLLTTFVTFVEKFLSDETESNAVQIMMTTHSAHVANTVEFEKIRYLRRHRDYVVCKPLGEFSKVGDSDEQKSHLEFLQKYMKLSYCDLYFCDKAILVEGASERLLVPDMISKCDEEGDFASAEIPLSSQYYSIIEVGGAYAHHFYDFLDYLEIPALILTDIDFVKGNNREKCDRSEAERSSNEAVNRWCRKVLGISGPVSISQILSMSDEQHCDGYRRIEFQKEENGFHPRSLEDSIMNCNRSIFGIPDGANPDFGKMNDKKTDFALRLLMDAQYASYKVPSYIRDGLIWLNNKSRTGD